jgi:hypothetical protein
MSLRAVSAKPIVAVGWAAAGWAAVGSATADWAAADWAAAGWAAVGSAAAAVATVECDNPCVHKHPFPSSLAYTCSTADRTQYQCRIDLPKAEELAEGSAVVDSSHFQTAASVHMVMMTRYTL